MNDAEKAAVVKDLLLFLHNCPKELKEKPSVAHLAINIGNALRSVSFDLERGEPQIWQPLSETPSTVYALAMQFREVGVYLWDKKPLENWVSEIDCLKKRVAFLEEKICQLSKKAGAK